MDFSKTWPVLNISPISTALRKRISQPSRPTFSASRSMHPSIAKLAWLAPNPRMAPQGGLFVVAATAMTSTFGTLYGPQAWPPARSSTLAPTDAYAPVSPIIRAWTAVRRPSASQPTR